MWKIPEPLHVSYATSARAVSSAEISFGEISGGVFQQTIVHATLQGVTRDMLFWWMHHIGDQVEWEGQRVLAYRLWHPRDHIHYQCDGPIQAGCRFRIVEAFGADRRFLIDNVFDVPKLDHSGFRIEARFAGAAIISVDEDWEDVPGGVRWTNTMRLSARNALLKPLVKIGRRVKQETFTAWLKHNVEEVGYIPEFLPQLHQALAAHPPA
jgi:hypothetical protein